MTFHQIEHVNKDIESIQKINKILALESAITKVNALMKLNITYEQAQEIEFEIGQ